MATKQGGRWGPYRPASPPPARHRPGARSARRKGLWRLGQGGDFTVNSTDPNPWFSHQHNAHYLDDSTLILFDNGNTRRASGPNADSRGQVWKLDEQTITAALVLFGDSTGRLRALHS
jgi:hypothetical protein